MLLVACKAPENQSDTILVPTALPQPTNAGIGKDAALRIAKDLFVKEQSIALSLYDISIEDDPKTGRWVVYFYSGAPPLIIVLVDKKTGQASLHGT